MKEMPTILFFVYSTYSTQFIFIKVSKYFNNSHPENFQTFISNKVRVSLPIKPLLQSQQDNSIFCRHFISPQKYTKEHKKYAMNQFL